MTDSSVTTWHHGLVARWWGEFNHDGDDIDVFRNFVAAEASPALDVGCGAGRVLLACMESGLEIEGLDAAADMLAECRRVAADRGLEPLLHHQPMHKMIGKPPNPCFG